MDFEHLKANYEVKENKNGVTVFLSQGVTLTTTKGAEQKRYNTSTVGMRHETIAKEDEYIKSFSDEVLENICLRLCDKIETGLKYGATPNELLSDFKEEYPKLERTDRTIENLKSRLADWLAEGQSILIELEML